MGDCYQNYCAVPLVVIMILIDYIVGLAAIRGVVKICQVEASK